MQTDEVTFTNPDTELLNRLLPVARRIFTDTFSQHYEAQAFRRFCDEVYLPGGSMAGDFDAPGVCWRVAMAGDHPIGYAKLTSLRASAPDPAPKALELQQLYVLQNWHGAGVASSLMEWGLATGGCVAIGFQSFAQVKAVYGEGAHTIIENCGNLLLLRAGASDGGGTAKLASDLIGDREVERDDLSRSRTRGRFTSRSMSMQTKRTVEDAALASEIMQLGNREGYLKRATSPRWLKVTFPYTDYPPRSPAGDR